MTPLEMAMKLVGSSNKCEKHKCPFIGKCKGDYATCTMKEIALMLRSQVAEIDSQASLIRSYQQMILAMNKYIVEIEKINQRYHDLVVAFQNGYRPKKKRYRPGRPVKRKKDPVEMDGDERYAVDPPRETEPTPPVVVI